MTSVFEDNFAINLHVKVPYESSQEANNNFLHFASTQKDLTFCQQIITNTLWSHDHDLAMTKAQVFDVDNFQLDIKITSSTTTSIDFPKTKKICKSAAVNWRVTFPKGKAQEMPFDKFVNEIEKSELGISQKIVSLIFTSCHPNHVLTPLELKNEHPYAWIAPKTIHIIDNDKELKLIVSSRNEYAKKLAEKKRIYSWSDLLSPLTLLVDVAVENVFRYTANFFKEKKEIIIFPDHGELNEKCQSLILQLQNQANVRQTADTLTEKLEQHQTHLASITQQFENGKEEIQRASESLEQLSEREKKLLNELKALRGQKVDVSEYENVIRELMALVQENNEKNNRLRVSFEAILLKERKSEEYRACIEEALRILEGEKNDS